MTSTDKILKQLRSIDPITELMFGIGIAITSIFALAIVLMLNTNPHNATIIVLTPLFIGGGIMLDVVRRV